MTETTALDTAHEAMQAAAGDAAARLRFYERLADAELFVLLTEEARGQSLSPELFDLDQGRFVLAFDREERLAGFAGRPAPYAALPGRVLAAMLAGQGVGLALNPDVAPSAILIPAEALGWLAGVLEHAPARMKTRIRAVSPSVSPSAARIAALDTALAGAAGLARAAYLAGVTYEHGAGGHLLGFVDAPPEAEAALAGAVAEALRFSGEDDAVLDVGFFAGSDPMVAKLAASGRRLHLPQPAAAEPRAAPGSDPGKPPILTRPGR